MTRGCPRWAAGALGVGLALMLVAAPSALAAANDPTPAQAIAELNAWRAQVGESAVSTQDVGAWDSGCQHHNQYEQDNGVLTHFEMLGNAGYTPDGAVAGPDSVLAEESGSPQPFSEPLLLPGPVWDSAVFHRAALLEPRLANIGFNATTFANGNQYTSWTCLWDQNIESSPYGGGSPAIDNSRTTAQLALYPSPANGAVNVPTVFPAGTESPDPGSETGVNGATLGWLINVEINGPWTSGGNGGIVWAHGVHATLTNVSTGTVVSPGPVVSQCGTTHCAGSGPTCSTASGGTTLGCFFAGGFGIFPLQPLTANSIYKVAITAGSLTEQPSGPPGTTMPISAQTWCFSTGPTYSPPVGSGCTGTFTGTEPGQPVFGLSLGIGGSGTVAGSGITCPTVCNQFYQRGSQVTLTATPAAGQRFVGWSGDCQGTSPTCNLTITKDLAASAQFAAIPPPGPPAVVANRFSLSLHPRLSFTVAKGTRAPAIKSIAITVPGGLVLSTKAKSLLKGVTIAGKPALSLKAHGLTLTISLKRAAGRVQAVITSPAMTLGSALLRKLRTGHFSGTLTFTLKILDAAGKATVVRLGYVFH